MPPPYDRTESPSSPRSWLLTAAAAVLGITLLALAAAPLSAPAEPTPPSVETEPFEFEDEVELETEECVESTEGLDEEGEEFCEDEEAESSADGCPLHSTKAHAATKRNKLKLTIGYTTFEPATARIEVRSGRANLGTYNRHLGRSGVLRFTRSLGKKHGDKVVIDIRVPSAGPYCAEEAAVLFK